MFNEFYSIDLNKGQILHGLLDIAIAEDDILFGDAMKKLQDEVLLTLNTLNTTSQESTYDNKSNYSIGIQQYLIKKYNQNSDQGPDKNSTKQQLIEMIKEDIYEGKENIMMALALADIKNSTDLRRYEVT